MVMHVSHVKDKQMKVIRFTASWCGPCKALEMALNEIDDKPPIEVFDIDEHPKYASEFGIRSVPTMIMTDGTTEVKRMVGLKQKSDLENWLKV